LAEPALQVNLCLRRTRTICGRNKRNSWQRAGILLERLVVDEFFWGRVDSLQNLVGLQPLRPGDWTAMRENTPILKDWFHFDHQCGAFKRASWRFGQV